MPQCCFRGKCWQWYGAGCTTWGDPVGAGRHVKESLSAGGTWLVVEPFSHDCLKDNLNPVGRVYYGASTMICTQASLSQEVEIDAQAKQSYGKSPSLPASSISAAPRKHHSTWSSRCAPEEVASLTTRLTLAGRVHRNFPQGRRQFVEQLII